MKTLILFDIGAVQLRIHYEQFFKEIPKLSSLPHEEFKRRYADAELGVNRGDLSTRQFLDDVRGIMDLRKGMSDKELKEIIGLLWKNSAKDVIELKRKLLKNRYIVGNFSNISEFAFEVISEKYPEIFESDSSFPGIYSYKIGAVKPDSRMYKAVKGFDRVVYIDDNDSYVRKGTEFGWNGILFTPFIDKSEAIRSAQKNEAKSSEEIVVANSFEELEEALRKLGFKF